jgi:hypothetical protein
MLQMQLDGVMLTKQRFTKMVESHVKQWRMSYMDSIVVICEDNGIELEEVKKYISAPMKEKIEAEAMRLNYLPRKNILPL